MKISKILTGSLFATLFAAFSLTGSSAMAGPDILDIGAGYETDFNSDGPNVLAKRRRELWAFGVNGRN